MPEWMALLVSYSLGGLAGLLSAPITVFVVEVTAAAVRPWSKQSSLPTTEIRPRVAVLVPAHNESKGLLPTIDDIKAQLRPGGRLLVVADNCFDDTAAVARAAGAEVIERNDAAKVGKGYALDWGIRHLRSDPPAIVIAIDADCTLAEGTIDRLATASVMADRPVQALYLMTAPAQSPINYQVAEFAWRVKNWLRPLGLSTLGLPCQLMGTGMAFPWDVIRAADLASGRIVEDLKLGLDLAAMGRAPLFCPSAVVTSEFPLSARGADNQRQRWEHGHFAMILTAAPGLIVRATLSGNWRLLALTLDMAVPPLGLLGLLTLAAAAAAGLAAAFGLSSAPLVISAAGLVSLALAALLSWLTFGRDILPPAAFLSLGPFILAKLRLYGRLLSRGPVSRWTRTDRN